MNSNKKLYRIISCILCVYKVKNMAVLYDGQVKMAHLAIAGSYSVNGVAALHTKILEERELKDFRYR